jgi:hypothetical protein
MIVQCGCVTCRDITQIFHDNLDFIVCPVCQVGLTPPFFVREHYLKHNI